MWHQNVTFENCSISSTNSPIQTLTSNGATCTITLKNSVFEVTNSVPIITGGSGETIAVKVFGISSNATSISNQSGTGHTITLNTNY